VQTCNTKFIRFLYGYGWKFVCKCVSRKQGQDLGKSKISANRLRLLGLLFTSTGDNKMLTKLLLHLGFESDTEATRMKILKGR